MFAGRILYTGATSGASSQRIVFVPATRPDAQTTGSDLQLIPLNDPPAPDEVLDVFDLSMLSVSHRVHLALLLV